MNCYFKHVDGFFVRSSWTSYTFFDILFGIRSVLKLKFSQEALN